MSNYHQALHSINPLRYTKPQFNELVLHLVLGSATPTIRTPSSKHYANRTLNSAIVEAMSLAP